MAAEKKHIARERLTIHKMIGIYCADHHGGSDGELCAECMEFQEYADRRLDKCPYGAGKPTCANCPIHCYKPAQREQVRKIMRYAGPRMILRHPFLAIAHKFDGLRRALHPRELTREQRTGSRRNNS